MAIGEYTAAFTSRYGTYGLLLVGLVLVGGFLYAFNFTSFFGGVTQ